LPKTGTLLGCSDVTFNFVREIYLAKMHTVIVAHNINTSIRMGRLWYWTDPFLVKFFHARVSGKLLLTVFNDTPNKRVCVIFIDTLNKFYLS
jgi:hypothetical protein